MAAIDAGAAMLVTILVIPLEVHDTMSALLKAVSFLFAFYGGIRFAQWRRYRREDASCRGPWDRGDQ